MRFTEPKTEALKRQLVRQFREWETREAQRLTNLFRGLHAALPLVNEAKAAEVRQVAADLEKTIDILSGRDDVAKFRLWKGAADV